MNSLQIAHWQLEKFSAVGEGVSRKGTQILKVDHRDGMPDFGDAFASGTLVHGSNSSPGGPPLKIPLRTYERLLT